MDDLTLAGGAPGLAGARVPTVLIVDDAEQGIAVLVDLLTPRHRLRIARSLEAAREEARRSPPPDLILLDVLMDGQQGYQVLECLKADPATRGIPVVCVTALDDVADEARGIALGAVDYLTKPVHAPLALARIEGHLERVRATAAIRTSRPHAEAPVRRLAELRRIRDVSVRTLANLADARDHETGDHLLRTQAYVRALAEELARHPDYREALHPEYIDLVSWAAPLHDIGKIGIPDHILHKPGPLTGDEWTVMQTHAELGARALRQALHPEGALAGLEFLEIAIDIAQSHHERWDGGGYPQGLAGTRIPLVARLTAVADVFDALITPRVYKHAMPVEEAILFILERGGTHFDPDVTAAFEARLATIRAIAAEQGMPAIA
jgi:putative two-component system response regulator